MNFLNLEYFLAAAEELNFTKAAKRLYISQQSLSTHITKLEEYFHAPLFDRTPPLTLTKEGVCLVRRAKDLLRIREETIKEINDIRDFKSGELTIGCTRLWGRVILPHVLPLYSRRFPNIRLHLIEGSASAVESSLQEGQVDLSIGYVPTDCSNLTVDIICREKMVLLVPYQLLEQLYPEQLREVKLALRETLDLSLLKDCPFLVMDPSTSMGAATATIFRAAGFTPQIALQSGNLETLMALCFQGMGCMFCPEVLVAEGLSRKDPALADSLGIYPLSHQVAQRYLSVNHLKNKYLPHAAEEFIHLTKSQMNTTSFRIVDLL